VNTKYIIVQAGGAGTRLEYLTANKPKALVPVENLPMLFHLFGQFPDKRYIIIADYKRDVLREYLNIFANVQFQVLDTDEHGTCAGIRRALELLPANEPFMLVWSDLILPKHFTIPNESGNYIGISETFPCRWSYANGEFEEIKSTANGVAGLFIFKDKAEIETVPEGGELVAWLKSKQLNFKTLSLAGTREYGLLEDYKRLPNEKCRPFNRVTIENDVFIKEAIDEQGKKLAKLERSWYKEAKTLGVMNIPDIYGYSPLKIERINGKNIYEYNLSLDEKKPILQKLTKSLKTLHGLVSTSADTFSVKEAYYNKTMDRLKKIRNLVPFADRKTININGKDCRNIFYYKRDLEKKLEALKCESFTFIHGDCTFSNLMLKNDTDPIFIDPRGYFGFTELYGDPNYDWAKLYYSVVGNYDRFNLKDFRLTIGENDVNLKITSNNWEALERDFFELSGTDPKTIKLLHAVIWLSLTTYAWQDYDSICGAFYNGLYYLEEVL
jgi:GTP:adenosylcobinamide-phosphate guanylyltransferase/aminoglycoside phosphotransferase